MDIIIFLLLLVFVLIYKLWFIFLPLTLYSLGFYLLIKFFQFGKKCFTGIKNGFSTNDKFILCYGLLELTFVVILPIAWVTIFFLHYIKHVY